MELAANLRPLCEAFLAGLKAALGDKLYAVVLYGAVTFPETAFTGDVDGHVLLTETLSEQEKSDIAALHAALARDYPPLAADLDVYYLLLADTQGAAPPPHRLRAGVVDGSWALHCAHIRAGRCISLYGPDPRSLYPALPWSDVEAALRGELRYVEEHLLDYPAYCVLNLCRLVYSFETRDVVISKAAAAAWARQALPEWQELIEAAQRFYAGQATADEEERLRAGAPGLLRRARERIGKVPAPYGDGHLTERMNPQLR